MTGNPNYRSAAGSGVAARLRGIAALAALLCCPLLVAQNVDDGYAPAVGGTVRTIHEQGDGRLLVGGAFTDAGGQVRNRLARFYPDGSLDSAFSPSITLGSGAPTIWAIHQQPSTVPGQGKILIGGNFGLVNGVSRAGLARLNVDGSVDGPFNVAVDSDVRSFDANMAPDGSVGTIFIAGRFTSVQGQPRSRVAAVFADGSLNNLFAPNQITTGQVNVLRVHRDQNGAQYGVLIGGAYTFAGQPATLRRLVTASGAEDTGFSVTTSGGTTFGNYIADLAVQPDGRILIAGDFDTVNGQARHMMARLHIDGSIDDSFVPPVLNGGVASISLQPDGRIVIGGSFTNLSLRNRVARLNEDGSLDTSYAALVDPNDVVNAVHVHPDGAATIAGQFTTVTGIPRTRLARLATGGGLERTLAITGAADGGVRALAVQADGKILVGGLFTQFNGVARTRLARLHGALGNVDMGFAPAINGEVYALAVMPDQRILVGGGFGSVNGTNRRRLALLNHDGTLDTSFNAQIPGGIVVAIVPQHDGRILIGGDFDQVGGMPRQNLARLHPDGTLDTSFLPPTNNGTVRAILVQPDGRVVIGGEFTTLGGGWTRNRIARLLANGNMDATFDAGDGASAAVRALAQTAAGDLIVAGNFTSMDSSPRNRIAALDPDGALLPTFADGANGDIHSVVPRIDGSIYIAGDFTGVAGSPRGRVARLAANGALLAGFDAQAANLVRAMTVQPDGKLLIGGTFEAVAGVPRTYLARLSIPEAVRHHLRWDQANQKVYWQWQGPAADHLHAPQLQVSTECCDDDSFIEVPGGADMVGGAIGVNRQYVLNGFTGLTGMFYLRAATITGDRGGVGTHMQYSPAWRFDGGEADDTLFANGFETH